MCCTRHRELTLCNPMQNHERDWPKSGDRYTNMAEDSGRFLLPLPKPKALSNHQGLVLDSPIHSRLCIMVALMLCWTCVKARVKAGLWAFLAEGLAVLTGGECGVPFWQRFFMPTGPIKWVDAQSQRRSPEWYSFDHGPIHFLQISTEVRSRLPLASLG